MSLQKGKRRKPRSDVLSETVAPQSSRYPSWLFPFALGAVVVGGGVYLAMADSGKESVSQQSAVTPAINVSEADLPSLGDLALMSEDELANQDLALMNLRCAEGLPGSENLDIGKCLQTLDQWARRVKVETDRHLYKYQQSPSEFENSEAYYRMMMLITVLQQDFKVHYNPERIREIDFTKSKDLFIHGMIGSGNGGTCVSMPVLYTAVARRLGYPVYLVNANAHVFCRWEDSKERFNIEATSQGMNSYDDEYYMKWPKPLTKDAVEKGWFLESLSNARSFASFLAARGHCLEDNKFGAKARVAYAMAAEKTPSHPLYFGFLAQTMGPRRQRQPDFDRQIYPPDPAWNQKHIEGPMAVAHASQPPIQHGQVPYKTYKPASLSPVNQYGVPQTQSATFPEPHTGFGFQP